MIRCGAPSGERGVVRLCSRFRGHKGAHSWDVSPVILPPASVVAPSVPPPPPPLSVALERGRDFSFGISDGFIVLGGVSLGAAAAASWLSWVGAVVFSSSDAVALVVMGFVGVLLFLIGVGVRP